MLARICCLFVVLITITACRTAASLAPVARYQQAHRPQFHFSPPTKWMNDPNGMVYYAGEYHLFYQYHPDSTVWGPMHWGHAVSRDLAHWEHLPVALYPDSLGYIFSGCAVVDWKNTSGFGRNGQPALVAIFTHHNMAGEKAGRQDFQYQSLAYSNDRGRSWTKYAGNPVLPNPGLRDFRDPKVVWDADSRQWVLILAAQDQIQLYGSPDLKKWTLLSADGRSWGAHGGVWECPDLFPIRVEGTGQKKWVLLQSLNPGGPNGGSGTQYFVGNFDGKKFTPEAGFGGKDQPVWLDWGRDNYAGVTWSDVPETDGRRLFLGWMSNWDYAQVVPTQAWRSAMTLPRQLTLHNTPAGLRLLTRPVKELEKLRGRAHTLNATTVSGALDLTGQLGFSPATAEVWLEIDLPPGEKTDFSVVLSNARGQEYRVGYDAAKNEFYSDRTKAGKNDFSPAFAVKRHAAPRQQISQTFTLHLFFDRASGELFADGGATVITDIFFPDEPFSRLKLMASGGTARVKTGKVWALQGIWR